MITKINGHPAESYDDLLLYIGSALAGSKVKLTVARSGEPRDVEVTLAKFSNTRPYIATVPPRPGLRPPGRLRQHRTRGRSRLEFRREFASARSSRTRRRRPSSRRCDPDAIGSSPR